uniref:TAFA chemokine like family member 5 n=1 Tax=Oreochromis niloticus TaxID=8128 RepID=A0A669DY33_ORENI
NTLPVCPSCHTHTDCTVLYTDRARKSNECHGQLVAGTCEIVTLDRDSSQPRRTIARQTARCACKKGQIAGTTRARPACVDVRIITSRQWCEMTPCLEDEGCNLLVNQSGWTCTQPGGRVKTTTVRKQA